VGLSQISEIVSGEIIKTQPQCIPAHAIALASRARQSNVTEEVNAQVTKSIPESSLGLYARISNHQRESQWEQAIECAEKLLAREPDHERAAMHLVQIYGDAKATDKAIAMLRTLYQKAGPLKAVAGNDLAYFLLEQGPEQLDQARTIANEVAKLLSFSPTILDTLGWIEHLSGNNEQALRLLSRAAPGNTASHDWHLHIGVVYAAQGEKAWAKRHLQAAKQGKGAIEQKASAALTALENASKP